MASETTNYGLKKPDPEDFVDIADLNGNFDKIDKTLKEKADLDTSGKIPAGQIPALSYIPLTQKAAANGVASLGADGKVPSGQLPSMNFVPTTEKGAAGGVATLGVDGKVPTEQIPALGYIPATQKAAANGVASLGADGKVPPSQLPASGMLPKLNVAVASTTSVSVTDGITTLTGSGSGSISFDIPNYGTWTVTMTQSGSTLTREVVIDTVKVYNITFDILENNSWAQIAEIAESGKASEYWSIGDEKNITVNGETLTLVIMDFNHDNLTAGGKAGITFGLKNLMTERRQMNETNTNVGGFTGSAMYSWLQNTLLPSLPADLQAAIKTVNKKTSAGSQSEIINTDPMKIFLFSEVEVFGTTTYSWEGEGSQYPYFATSTQRIKYLENGEGSALSWWERSPYANYSATFCAVSYYGNAISDNASFSRGVCFGFCV